MIPEYPKLPLYIIVRGVDYNADTEALSVSPGTPHLTVTVGTTKCFPLFSTRELAQEFLGKRGGTIVPCNAERLLLVLPTLDPAGVTIDPDLKLGRGRCHPTGNILNWLKREASRPRK